MAFLAALIPAAIAAGASIIGSKQASSAAGKTNAANLAIAQENADLQRELLEQELAFTEEQNALQRAIAQRIQDIQLQGFTGPQGETVRFQEGQGFVSTLAPIQQALLEAGQQNQLQAQTVGAERARGEAARGAGQRADISNLVNSLINQAQQPGISPERIEGLLRTGISGATNRAFDKTLGQVGTQALRTGSDPTTLFRALAEQRAQTLSDQQGGIELQAIKEAGGINTARTNAILNQLQVASGLAGGGGGNILAGGTLNDALTGQAAQGGARVAQAGNLFAQGQAGFPSRAGQGLNFQQQVDPNAGSLVSGTGDILSAALEKIFAQQQSPARSPGETALLSRISGSQGAF